MRDLQEYFRKAMTIVEDCGIDENFRIIEVKKLRKNANNWGTCACNPNTMTAVIKINPMILDETIIPSDESLLDTMIHEILHACANYGDGHEGMWAYYAEKVRKATGMKLHVTESCESMGMTDEAINNYRMERMIKKNKYIVRCSNPQCECKWGFSRMCDKVRYPQHYRCGRCRSTLVRSF